MSAVWPLDPSKFTGAPASSSATISLRLPLRAASARGGKPSAVWEVMGAPRPSRVATAATSPTSHAAVSAFNPGLGEEEREEGGEQIEG